MPEPHILIKFDGGDADRHELDMRLLGRSLVGFDRIISDGVILITQNRLPKKGERQPFSLYARSPEAGSLDVYSFLQESAWILPLGWEFYQKTGGKIVWEWVSFVLKFFGGRKAEAEAHLEAMIKMREIEERGRAESEERWHAQIGAFRDQTYELLNRLVTPAANAVSPVGPSAEKVSFKAGTSSPTEVDVPMADAIRSKGENEVGDLQEMTLTVDGYTHHNKTLKIERPDQPGRFMSADVRDPSFESAPNIYTRAAEAKESIKVMAKPAHRAGRLERIYIMDFIGPGD